jgi:hypothetical protein
MQCGATDAPALNLTSAALPAARRASLHAAICDSCDNFIVGTRYHCAHSACADFDLCDRCVQFEGTSHLASHSLLVLPRPCASLAHLVSTCPRFDVKDHRCSCGSAASAQYVCSACAVSICDACRTHHDESHLLIWTRISRQNCPRLPPVGVSCAAHGAASPTGTNLLDPSHALLSVRDMVSRDLDGVMLIEHASFSVPYARDVFEQFAVKSLEHAACCWGIVAVTSCGDSHASDSEAVCGYCLCDASGSSVRVISIGTGAMYRGQGVGSLLLRYEPPPPTSTPISSRILRVSASFAQILFVTRQAARGIFRVAACCGRQRCSLELVQSGGICCRANVVSVL